MKKAIPVAMSFIILAAIACKKDKDDEPPVEEPPTSVEIITSTKWNIDSIGFDSNNDGAMDDVLSLEDCEADNKISFASDSSGVFDFGALKCDDSEPQTVNFDWYFKQNDQVIYIDGDLPGELEGDINVKTLNDSVLVMSKPLSFPVNTNLIVALKK